MAINLINLRKNSKKIAINKQYSSKIDVFQHILAKISSYKHLRAILGITAIIGLIIFAYLVIKNEPKTEKTFSFAGSPVALSALSNDPAPKTELENGTQYTHDNLINSHYTKNVRGNESLLNLEFNSERKIQISLRDNNDTQAISIENGILYQNIYSQIDLRYENYIDHVKETIILKSEAAQKVLTFEFNLAEDITFESHPDGGIIAKSSEKSLFYIHPINAWDASSKSIDFQYILNKIDDGYTITVAPKNPDDLESLEYPITIDPTISWDFDGLGEYFLSDPTKIEIVDGLVRLKNNAGSYATDKPFVITNNPTPYSSLASFSETLGTGNQGSIQYQLSKDGITWYYWNGSAWAIATTSSQANLATVVNSNIGAFSTQLGAGSLYVKAFLIAPSSSTPVELQNFTVGYNYALSTPTINTVTPSSGSYVGGTPVTISGSNFYNQWLYKKKITIDETKIPGQESLQDYVLAVSLTDLDLRHTANGGKVGKTNGGDIKFTLADGVTKLNHEIERYVPTTGELVAWVRIPYLSAINNTDLYMFYGNAAAANQWNQTGTWSSDYKAVYHLSDPHPNDDFSASTLDTTKWTAWNNVSISSGRVLATTTATPQWTGSGLNNFNTGKFFRGDFDVQFDFDASAWGNPPSDGHEVVFNMHTVSADGLSGGPYGYYISYLRYANGTKAVGTWQNETNAGWGQQSTTLTASKLRMTRSGKTLTTYYWNGSSWANLGSYTGTYTGDRLYFTMYVGNRTSGTAVGNTYLDNFIVNSGNPIKDSTINANHGSNFGATPVAGQLGGGYNFTGASNNYIEIPNSSTLENIQENNYSIGALYKPASAPSTTLLATNAQAIVMKRGWHIGLSYSWNNPAAGVAAFYHYLSNDANVYQGALSTSPVGSFYHSVGTVNRTIGRVDTVMNGVKASTAPGSFAPNTASREFGTIPWRLGISDPAYTDYRWPANGVIDEVRILSTAQSADKSTAEYNNQMSPSTFYSVGPEETALGVFFGDTLAENIKVVDSNTITITTPLHAPGTYDVKIVSPDGQVITRGNSFTFVSPFPEPTITNITPDSGTALGGTDITITGSNFITESTGGEVGWNQAPESLPVSLLTGAIAVVGNNMYIYGGNTTGPVNTIYTASTASPTVWTNTGKTLPTTLYGQQIAVVGEKMYMMGGYTASGVLSNSIYSASTSDPTTWVNTGKTLPGTLSHSTLSIFGNRLYLYGGYGPGSVATNVIYSALLSDPTTWVNTGKVLPASLLGGASFVIGDYVYFYGGYTGSTNVNTIYRAHISDPGTFTNTGKVLPQAVRSTNMAVIGDYLYIFGGAASTAIMKAPVSDPTSWTVSAQTLPNQLSSSHLAIVNDNVYLFGGYGVSSNVSVIYRAPITRNRENIYMPSWKTNWRSSVNGLIDLSFGGVKATNIKIIDSNTVTATVPAHPGGVVDVHFTNYDGQSGTLSQAYTYIPAPSITSISPNKGIKTGGTVITINGSDFLPGAQVSFGGISSSGVTFVNSSTLEVLLPTHIIGIVDVSVTNPDNQTSTLANSFTYTELIPVITQVNPDNGRVTGGTEVTITGENFYSLGNYSKPISITNTSGNRLTDYQVQLTLDTAALVTAGKMRADGGDIRFTDSDDLTILPYWLESGINTTTTKVWVKVPSIPTSGKTINFVYGNLSNTSQSNSAAVFDNQISNLQASWNMNETSGTGVADSSGSNTGTATGTTIVDGKFGKARNFNGGTDYINVPNNASLNYGTGNFTLEAWFKTTGTGNRFIIDKTTTGIPYTGYVLEIVNNHVRFQVNDGSTYTKVEGLKVINDGNWHHAVVVRTGSTATIYVDGVLDNSGLVTSGNTSNSINLNIGNYRSAAGFGWSGALDNVAIYNKALTLQEISSIYSNAIYSYSGTQYIRKLASAQPTFTVGAEIVNQFGVSFGNIAATNVQWVNSTTIRATTPAHAVGLVDIKVVNSDGEFIVLPSAFTYVGPPVVDAITPNYSIIDGGDVATINGTDFREGSRVFFGEAESTNVTFINNTQLIAIIPPHPKGRVNVIVTNPDNQSGTLFNGFNYIEQLNISGLNPSSGPISGGTDVRISATGLGVEYSRTLTINNTNTALTNFQVAVTIDTGILISQGKMKSNGGDIRFELTDSTNIPYWVESGLNTNKTKIWLKIPSLPTGSTQVIMKYGDSSLNSESNGTAVFDIFDDFLGTNIDTSKWTVNQANATATVSGGILTLDTGADQGATSIGIGYATSNLPYHIETRALFSNVYDNTNNNRYRWNNGNYQGGDLVLADDGAHTSVQMYFGGWTGTTIPTNTYLKLRNTYRSNSADWKIDYEDNTSIFARTYTPGSSPSYIHFNVGDTGSAGYGRMQIDWVLVRKATTTDPTVTIGTESATSYDVKFDGISASKVIVVDSSTIIATTPAHQTSTVDVKLTRLNGGDVTLPAAFNYINFQEPIIDNVNPEKGPTSGNTLVTLTGSNLGYLYRRPITISNTGTDVYDYQIPITLNTQELISAGKMKVDGSDIRILNTDNYTELPYWIESGINTTTTKLWVKVPILPNGSKTIYLVYGNEKATAQSNGSNVFDFFDGFSGSSLDSTKWSNSTTGASISVSNGELIMDTGADQGYAQIGHTQVNLPYEVQTRMKVFGAYDSTNGTRIRFNNTALTGIPDLVISEDASHTSIQIYDGAWTGAIVPTDVYHISKQVYNSTTLKWELFRENNTQIYSRTFNRTSASGAIYYAVGDGGGTNFGKISLDYVFTRKYISTEPTTSIGNEEIPAILSLNSGNAVLTSIDNTEIKFLTPTSNFAGPVDLTFTNYFGETISLTDGFSYYPDKYAFISYDNNIRATEPGEITIQAQDANGNIVVVSEDITISLNSTSSSTFFAHSLEEDPSTQWDYNMVTIPAGSSSVLFYYKNNQKSSMTLTGTGPAGDLTTPATVNLNVSSKYRLLVTGVTNPVKSGVPSSVTVQAVDYQGTPLVDYEGMIQFSSSDPVAVLPENYYISQAELGGRTFVNAVTMITQGSWCISAEDINDPDVTGEQCGISVTAPNAGTIARLKLLNGNQTIPLDGRTTEITVQAQDAGGVAIPTSQPTTIYLYSDSPTGQFSLDGVDWTSSPFTTTISQYATSKNFFYRDPTLGGHQITVRDDYVEDLSGIGPNAGWLNDQSIITTASGSAYKLNIASLPATTIAGGSIGPIKISVQDIAGNDLTALQDKNVYVTVTPGSGQLSINGESGWSNSIATKILVTQTTADFYFRSNSTGQYTIVVSDSSPANGNEGLLDKSQSILVQPAQPEKLSLITAPSEVIAGEISQQFTVQLKDLFNNPYLVSENTTLFLSTTNSGGQFSSNQQFSSTIAQIVIPANQSTTTFYFKQSTYVPNQTIYVTDTIEGFNNENIDDVEYFLNIVSGTVNKIATIQTSPVTATAGQEIGPIDVIVKNTYDVEVPLLSDLEIYFYSNSTAILKQFSLLNELEWNSINSYTMPTGTSRFSVFYKDTNAGNTKLTFADDISEEFEFGLTNAQLDLSINADIPVAVKVTSSTQSVTAGQVTNQIRLELKDQYSNTAQAIQPTTINLSSTSSEGRFDVLNTGSFDGSIDSMVFNIGETTKNIYYKDTQAGTPTIEFTANGLDSDSQTVNVSWGSVASLGLTTPAFNLVAGVPSENISLKLFNQYGVNVPTSANLTVNLNSNSAQGSFDVELNDEFNTGLTNIIVQAGENEKTFRYKDTKSGTSTVTASGAGIAPANIVLNVSANIPAGLRFTTNDQTIEAGNPSNALDFVLEDSYGNTANATSITTVNLNVSPSLTGKFDTTRLGSYNGTVSQIIINSGNSAGRFYYKDIEAGNNQITIDADGLTPASQDIEVVWGNITNYTLTTAQTQLTAGQSSESVVIKLFNAYGINVAATSDFEINLSSTHTEGRFDVSSSGSFDGSISTITIPSGQKEFQFYFKDTKSGSVNVSAQKSGFTTRTITYNIVASSPYKIGINNVPPNLITGQRSADITFQIQDQYNNPTNLTTNTTFYLHSTSSNHQFLNQSNQVISSINITSGQSQGIISYRDYNFGNSILTIGDSVYPEEPDLGLINATTTINVIYGSTKKFRLESPVSSLSAGEAVPVTLIVLNEYDQEIPAQSNISVNLSSNSISGQFGLSDSGPFNITSVNIGSDQSRVNVYYTDTATGNIIISASRDGHTPGALAFNFTGAIPYSIVIDSTPQTITAGNSSGVIILRLRDQYGNYTVANEQINIGLDTSDSVNGKYALTSSGPWNITTAGIAQGNSEVRVYYRDTMAGTKNLSFSANLLTAANQNITVIANNPTQVKFEPTESQNIIAQNPSQPIEIVLYDVYNNVAKAVSTMTFNLSSNSSQYQFSLSNSIWSNITQTTIATGASKRTIYYKDWVIGSPTINVKHTGSIPAATQQHSIVPGTASKLLFKTIPTLTVVDTPTPPIQIFIADQNNYQTTVSQNTLIQISTSSVTGQFSIDGENWNSNLDIDISEGESSLKEFYYIDSSEGNPVITLTASGLTSTTQTQTIVSGDISKIVLNSNGTVTAGEIIEITLQTQTLTNMPVSVKSNTQINLTTSSSGQFSLTQTPWNPITSFILTKWQNTATIFYRDTFAGSVNITARENPEEGWTDAQSTIFITAAEYYRINISNGPADVVADEPSTGFVVQTLDEFGNIVTNSSREITLFGPSSSAFSLNQTEWNNEKLTLILEDSEASKTFYYRDLIPGTKTIIASDKLELDNPDIDRLNGSRNINVLGQSVDRIVVKTPQYSGDQSIVAGNYTEEITIQALKSDGTPAIIGSPLQINLGTLPSSIGQFRYSTNDQDPLINTAEISTGNTEVTIYFKTTLAGEHMMNFSSLDITGDNQSVEFIADEPAKISVISTQQSIVAGIESTLYRTQVQDQYDNPVKFSQDRIFRLASSSLSGKFSLQNGASWVDISDIILPAGNSDLYYYYKDTSVGTHSLSVIDNDTELTSGTQNVLITSAGVYRINFISAPNTLAVNQTSNILSVGLYDEFGNVTTTNENIILYLFSSSASGKFSANSNFNTEINSINITSGLSSAVFYYRDQTAGTPTITVSDKQVLDNPDVDLVNAVQQQTINWGNVTQMKLTNASSSMRAGDVKLLQLRLFNQYSGEVQTPVPLTVYLYTSSTGGLFSLENTFGPGQDMSAFTIAQNTNGQDFYYKDTKAGTATVTVSDISTPPETPDLSITNATQTFTIQAGDLARFVYITPAQNLIVGQTSSQIIVQARDIFGNIKSVENSTPLYLYSSSPTAQFSLSTNFGTGNTITQTTINGGFSTAVFYYRDFTYVAPSSNPRVTVSNQFPKPAIDDQIIDAEQIHSVSAGNISKISFLEGNNLGTVVAGSEMTSKTIVLKNQYDVEIPTTTNRQLYLFTTSVTGSFARWSAGSCIDWGLTTLTINTNSSRISFCYRDSAAGDVVVTVSDTVTPTPDTGWTNAIGNVIVEAGNITQMVFLNQSLSNIIARHPSQEIQLQTRNSFGNPTNVTSPKTIYLRSSSATGEFAISPTGPWGINFITMPANQHTLSIYYRDSTVTIGNPVIITAADTLPLNPDINWTNATINVSIVQQTVENFLVTNVSDPQIQGNPSSIVVMARDADNYIVDWYTGTINFTSSDSNAILPDSYTFTASDKGIKTFTNGVAFSTPGEHFVRVVDANLITGQQNDVTVVANSAGPLAQVKFKDITPPLYIQRDTASSVISVQLQDINGQGTNAGAGGFPIRLSSDSPTGQFSMSPNGPWTSQGLYSVPQNFSSINVYYKDSSAGTPSIIVSDWISGQDDPGIANDSLLAIINTVQINIIPQLQVNNNRHVYVNSPHIFGKDETGYYYAKSDFQISTIDALTGQPQNSDLLITWKSPAGTIIKSENVSNVNSYIFNVSSIEGNANATNYKLEVSATTLSPTFTSSTELNIPVSGWSVDVYYDENNRVIGNPLPFTVRTRYNGALTDPVNFSVNFRDNNAYDITSSQFLKYKIDMNRTSTGVYTGQFDTNGLTPNLAYYLYARVFDVQNFTLAEDNHHDIFFKNNVILAPKNFEVEKQLISTPPATEQFNLRFKWDAVSGATKYSLYRTTNRNAQLFQDTCTIQDIRQNRRNGDEGVTDPGCETMIQQNVGTDVNTNWVELVEINAPATSYTLPWAQISSDSNTTYYYIIRAENGYVESAYSTMAYTNRSTLTFNVAPVANVNWVSMPFSSQYKKVSDIVMEIEGGIEGSPGDSRNKRIDSITLWDSQVQGSTKIYYYYSDFDVWIGDDFEIKPGDGLSIVLSGKTPSFNWTVSGTDVNSTSSFSFNTPPLSNVNWVSVPYTTKFRTASDIVEDLEGGLEGTPENPRNKKIDSITLWDPSVQGSTKIFYYYPDFDMWIGDDFQIKPGTGFSMVLSGRTIPNFNWQHILVINPYK